MSAYFRLLKDKAAQLSMDPHCDGQFVIRRVRGGAVFSLLFVRYDGAVGCLLRRATLAQINEFFDSLARDEDEVQAANEDCTCSAVNINVNVA